MNNKLWFVPPYRLLIIHTFLIPLFMFALSQKWFLTDIPFDCFYGPFFIISGPSVYFIAHYIQHVAEKFFAPEQIIVPWNIIPGGVCLLLGGLQWWFIELLWLKRRKSKTKGK